MEKQYFKNCPNCDELQTYTTKSRLECSIREKWVCNKCSTTHQKKIYSDDTIDNIVKLYESGVMKVTNQQPINELPNYKKRGNSGVLGSYHLDHKYSILEGFKNKISPKIIGGIKNLEFIPWEENIKKRTKCRTLSTIYIF
jgi:ribosomal protein L37AE/L43A